MRFNFSKFAAETSNKTQETNTSDSSNATSTVVTTAPIDTLNDPAKLQTAKPDTQTVTQVSDTQKSDTTQPSQSKPTEATIRQLEIAGIDTSKGWSMIEVTLQDYTPDVLTMLGRLSDAYIKYIERQSAATNKTKPVWAESNKNLFDVLHKDDQNKVAKILLAIEASGFLSEVSKNLQKANYNYNTSKLQPYINASATLSSMTNSDYKIFALTNYKDSAKNQSRFQDVFAIKIGTDKSPFIPRSEVVKVSRLVTSLFPKSDAIRKNQSFYDILEDAWLLFKPDTDKLNDLESLLDENGYDTTQLRDSIAQFTSRQVVESDKEIDPSKTIQSYIARDQTKFLLKIRKITAEDLNNELQVFIQTAFPRPGYLTDLEKDPNQLDANPAGMHLLSKSGFHYLFGTYNDFNVFVEMLKMHGWDTKNLIQQIDNLVDNGMLDKTRVAGQLDGYEKRDRNNRVIKDDDGNTLYDVEKFGRAIDDAVRNPNGNLAVELYPKQKDGVKWLYQRNSAILGDKTGTGKTIETLIAAKLRAEKENKSVLIVTLKSTLLQWANEIINKLQEDPKDILVCAVDLDPKNYDFTVSRLPSLQQMQSAKYVLIGYSSFRSSVNRDADGAVLLRDGYPDIVNDRSRQIVKNIMQSDFAVLVLDEAHMCKNADASGSQVLSLLCPKIPFKWAASATSVANTPMDVLNLLTLTDHSLGTLSKMQFERRYVGTKLKIRDLKSPDAKQKLAEKLSKAMELKKALVFSQAYLSRSKKDMRPDIPKHAIRPIYMNDSNFDLTKFVQELQDLQAKYGEKSLAFMTKQRKKMAELKVSATIEMAKRIVSSDKRASAKILIFSNFIDVCKSISQGLKDFVASDENLMGFKVMSIIGETKLSDMNSYVNDFKNDPLSKFLVISSRKGGTGISLEDSASYVIVNDFDWSPSVVEQVEGRAYRITNTQDVKTFYVVLKGNTDVEDSPTNPDHIWYNYLRTKIAVQKTTQDLEPQTIQDLLTTGKVTTFDKILEQQLKDAQAEAELEERFNNLSQKYGGGIIFDLNRDGDSAASASAAALDDNLESDELEHDLPPNLRNASIESHHSMLRNSCASWYHKALKNYRNG